MATGRHVLAIAAAQLGAACVDVRLGSLARAVASGPYDVVLSNPP